MTTDGPPTWEADVEVLLARPAVEIITGLSGRALDRLLARGQFPAPLSLTEADASTWSARDLAAWQARRALPAHS